MSNATKRTLLRYFHLILSIPILGYIYEPAEEVKQYADPVRYLFVPLMLLSGYWMYAGVIFAVAGVALWIGSLSGWIWRGPAQPGGAFHCAENLDGCSSAALGVSESRRHSI